MVLVLMHDALVVSPPSAPSDQWDTLYTLSSHSSGVTGSEKAVCVSCSEDGGSGDLSGASHPDTGGSLSWRK